LFSAIPSENRPKAKWWHAKNRYVIINYYGNFKPILKRWKSEAHFKDKQFCLEVVAWLKNTSKPFFK